jgi:lactoylglutathione lyase
MNPPIQTNSFGIAQYPRLLHTMIRVSDLERSLAFYLDGLGMRELRREDYPKGRFTLVFVGYGSEASSALIELTHNWDHNEYEHGTRFGHIAIGISDLNKFSERLKSMGIEITREPGPMSFASDSGNCDVIAFVKDPDGYQIELIAIHSI